MPLDHDIVNKPRRERRKKCCKTNQRSPEKFCDSSRRDLDASSRRLFYLINVLTVYDVFFIISLQHEFIAAAPLPELIFF